MTRKAQKVEFEGATGETLAGRLDMPGTEEGQGGREPIACALFAHCFTCSKDSQAATRISTALAELGLAVLRFDFTGLGGSGGDFAHTNFSSNVADLVAAADFLRQRHQAPRLLIGHSLGGAAVLAATAMIPESRAVVTVGAPHDPEHVRHLLEEAEPEVEARGEACINIAGRRFRIQRRFLEDLEAQEQGKRLAQLEQALLVMHAPDDRIVDIDNARRIFEAARHPKSFVSLDDADHLLSRPEDGAYVASVVAAWAARYLPEGTAPPSPRAAASPAEVGSEATATGGDGCRGGSAEKTAGEGAAGVVAAAGDEVEEGTVRVAERGDGKFTQVILDGRHELLADEPEAHGGDDRGPSPYELLLAALGACTSMTLRMYADRKEWPLEGVSVDLRHDKIHAEDCAHCDTKEGKIDRIERRISLLGDLDDEQRQRLLEIAARCPVHRTLEGEIDLQTRLVG